MKSIREDHGQAGTREPFKWAGLVRLLDVVIMDNVIKATDQRNNDNVLRKNDGRSFSSGFLPPTLSPYNKSSSFVLIL